MANVERTPPDDGDASVIYARSQLADIEGHVQAITARLIVALPVLNGLNEDLRREMRAWLRQLSPAVMEVLLTGADFDVLGPMLEAVGRRRKSLGIDQAQTMESSRHGQQALHDHAREFFRGHPQESELMAQIVPRLLEYQHVMTMSIARGYASGTPLDDATDRRTRLQQLLDVLLGRAAAGPSDVHDRAAELGIRLPLTMVSVSTPMTGDLVEQSRPVARMNHWAVVGLIGDRIAALTVRNPNAFPSPAGTALLPETMTPEQLTAAVARAAAAADVAQRLHLTEMTAVDAAPFAAVLALPDPEQRAYVRSLFGNLPGTPRGRSLLNAVSASLTSSRLADAALSLHVHRHTLDYRLRRFSDQTGLDLSDPVVRLRCTLGLFLLGLLPATEQS